MYLYILVSIILTLLFAFGCNAALRKHAGSFYILAVLIILFEVIYYQTGLRDAAPEWLTQYIVNPFKRGALPTAMFIVVMYIGALDTKNPSVNKLMGIRGELSIIACILTLGHNIVYGQKHFVNLFTNPSEMKPQAFIAAIISLVMIAIMLPLMITSFTSVRKKMRTASWKNLQRLAYPFFALIYIHVMVLFVPKFSEKYLDIIAYTLIFGIYAVLRITKAVKTAKNNSPQLDYAENA
ncbi:ferric reductase-like transmembrane domain-containing protein [Anaerotignum sp.]|uniref:ferric reductase-like transmembrane domain-containing protein n=1 Tax=Anaerotignum sp. TaxID=2039241 RepID=UPI002A91B2E1|nr:ferric reductase-like transmembrane domain-containing protein [Anaerotignum sp.]MCI7656370.1 ferric reductase-like transmembrane domain-containing protein [Clostridia bacterium]MDY5414397.1 hypothetical protein [Anaerotignum sp.]